jgi:hypothetical protein
MYSKESMENTLQAAAHEAHALPAPASLGCHNISQVLLNKVTIGLSVPYLILKTVLIQKMYNSTPQNPKKNSQE